MDRQRFMRENLQRIQAVESSFRPSGRPLSKPGRVLVGQGHLVKQGRRRPQLKAFFLFTDVLVYGSTFLNTRWHKNQKIIALEELELEDMEDGLGLRNQWLIRTPRKSFFVSASCSQEKRAWMDNLEECRANVLQGGARRPGAVPYAPCWIPDQAACKCMRCFAKFTATNRRHHCRKCGFLVCNSCSGARAVIRHMDPAKKLRVCGLCHAEGARVSGRGGSEEEDAVASGGEEEGDRGAPSFAGAGWLDAQTGTWTRVGTYVTHAAVALPPKTPAAAHM